MLGIKKLYKAITPPIIDNQLRLILKVLSGKGGYFSGPYSNWEQAKKKATGYDAEEIINTVRKAALAQKLHHTFMRDGFEFATPDHSHPLLTALFTLSLDKSYINVLDFGGGLGSTYYNTKKYIAHENFKLIWHIVEQRNFVNIGQIDHQTETLFFFENINHVNTHIDIVIISGVLQYLPNLSEVIKKIKDKKYPYIFIDRLITHVEDNQCSTIMVEHVPTYVYKASYPCRVFNYKELVNTFTDQYDIVYEFIANEGYQNLGNVKVVYKGVFLKLK